MNTLTADVMSRSATTTATAYAGFWRRFAALFLDGLILGSIAAAVAIPTGGQSTFSAVLGVLLNLAYQVYFITSSGQTLGAKVLGIKIVDADGNLLTTGGAVARVLGAYASGALLGIGYLMMLWDDKKQTLHDKMAGSYVVQL